MLTKVRVHGENFLLDGLPNDEHTHLIAQCEQVELVFADVIAEPGDRIRHVYFPTDSHISLVSAIDDRASLEVALVGNEGMYGTPLALGIDVSSVRAIVQGGGAALRMKAAPFRRELKDSAALRRKLSRYIYVQMTQLAQTAACARFHVVEARLARWLAMTRDRVDSDELLITQEFLAHMLGVRRVGITTAAGALQKHKLITYSRGIITVLDRRGLEAASCPCYRADKETYDRVMN